MKLDYLQFLELEVFTRFGSRLEAGVEAKIRRGRLLRELLKQERLAPLSPEQQHGLAGGLQRGFVRRPGGRGACRRGWPDCCTARPAAPG